MVDTQVAPVPQARSRMDMVFEVIEERLEAGEPPFVDVLEVVDAMEESGLKAFDIGIAVSRLVCERRLRFALDGIRLLHSEQ